MEKDRFTKRFQANAEDMTIQVEKEAPLSYTLNVQAKKESTIAAQILYFAGWKAYVDGKETPISYQPNGIIHVNMPSGEHTLRVRFEETPLRLLADSISLLSLFSLLAFGICKALYDNRSAHKSTF